MPTVAFATLGCRVNQADTEEMQAGLEAAGFRSVAFGEPADVVVVNSCTVTARADLSDRQMVRRAARTSPRGRVVVTGCWAQVDSHAAARAGAHLVVSAAEKPRLPALLDALLAVPREATTPTTGDPESPTTDDPGCAPVVPEPVRVRPGSRARAFLKAQDGCQHRCAFCIVPAARGASRSVEPAALLARARALVAAGHAELVLTGIDLGHYGADLGPRTTLAALTRALVETIPVPRLRLSSVLPAYFSADLLDVLLGSAAIAPHLHVPLQSGSDRVLRRMRRPYSVAMYRRVVERLSRIPRLGLGADVIAGFPGETDADFDATLALVDELPFTYLHVFAYSARAGTEATRLDGQVDERIIGQRSRRLRERAGDKARAFRQAMVGRTEDVVVLHGRDRESGRLVGVTGNGLDVVVDGPDALARGMTRVRLTGVEGERMAGELA
jgi:threonylcarbamoyladenosine tRNA methylthiotransferase MtaB